ncbi:hypothetical protein GCM10025869_11670 [Homoserinibacter gongjuensis]|uniref:Lipoyl-binding domain-containing protein n=1 Tax=Homoserinibacter gongjuensis TaxID=1162968 RepID=A0ABQ6JRA2_9MICO|nr:hypothetical protein GCM10025869_11670 [Homoserinibacter gongjuensis]
MAHAEFPLPDVGEGLTEAEIVAWKVKPGDQVTVNQVLVEIETAKSLVELPSPFAGTVTELLAEEGATVEVGAPIIRVDSVGGTIELQAPANDSESLGTVSDPGTMGSRPEAEDAASGSVLVGYGSKGVTPPRAAGVPARPCPSRVHPVLRRRRPRLRASPRACPARRCLPSRPSASSRKTSTSTWPR